MGSVTNAGLQAGGTMGPSPTSVLQGVPYNIVAIAGDRSATVYFNTLQPGNFTATSSNGTSASGTTSPLVVGGLVNGVPVTFTVTATGSVASSKSNSVTPSATPSTTLGTTLGNGLAFWWEALNQPSPPANGATLATLPDLSGNGFNFSTTQGAVKWLTNWSGGKPALTFDGGSNYSSAASGLSAGTFGAFGTICLVYDVSAQPNSNGVYEQRIISSEQGSNSLAALNEAGYAVALTPTANAGANNCTSIHSQSGAGVNGRGSYLKVQSAQLATIGQKILVIAQAPGTLLVSQNGGGLWTTVTGLTQPGADALQNFTGATAAAFPWSIGGMTAGAFNSQFQGHLAAVIIYNRILTAPEILAMQTHLASLI